MANNFSNGANWENWRPRTTFATITDGTSNTALIAEKHISIGGVGQLGGREARNRDGSPYFHGGAGDAIGGGGWGEAWAMGAVRNRPLARGANQQVGNIMEVGQPNLGSWHPGIVQFLVGDGSVRGVNITIDLLTLDNFGNAQSGVPINLP